MSFLREGYENVGYGEMLDLAFGTGIIALVCKNIVLSV
jgi:ubiquinone/menaquinone biosynthesis C-methylase UbiE